MRDAFGGFVGIKTYTDIAEACDKLGLNRTCIKRDLRVADRDGDYNLGYPDLMFTVWEDDDTILGPVGDGYQVVQYPTAAGIAQPCLDKGFLIRGGGLINRGERMAMVLESTDSFEVAPGDHIVNRVTLLSSHDGTGKLIMLMTPYRPETKTVMRMEVSGLAWKHTLNVHQRIAEGRKAFKKIMTAWDDFSVSSQRMQTVKLTDAEARSFIAQVLPSNKKEVSTRLENMREDVYQEWKGGLSKALPSCNGTLFGLVQSFAVWADHKKVIRASAKRNEEACQFDAKFIKDGAEKKAKAFAAAKILMNSKLKGGLSGATLKFKRIAARR